MALQATGWLGTSPSEQVAVWAGVQNLSAYGVGTTVQTDLLQDAGDPALTLNVGAGGILGAMTLENVARAQVLGSINQLFAQYLQGDFSVPVPAAINQLELAASAVTATVHVQDAALSAFETTGDFLGSIYQAYLIPNFVLMQGADEKPEPAQDLGRTLQTLLKEQGGSLSLSQINTLIQQGGDKELNVTQSAALATLKAYFTDYQTFETGKGLVLNPTVTTASVDAIQAALNNPNTDKNYKLAQLLSTAYNYYLKRINATSTDVFPQMTPNLADIQQAGTGDCAFIAAVDSLVNIDNTNPPQGTPLITSMIQPVTIKGQVMYQVSFPGVLTGPVTVAPPTRAEIALYSNAGKNGLWLTILEEAYCKYKNDAFFTIKANLPQDKLKTGETLRSSIEVLTGNKTINLTSRKVSLFPNLGGFIAQAEGMTLKQEQTENQIQTALVDAFNAHEIITLGVPKDVSIGPDVLAGPHAYTITNINMKDPKNTQFTIQNPANQPILEAYGASFTENMDFLYKYFDPFTIQDKSN
jgi:hypothetical protein